MNPIHIIDFAGLKSYKIMFYIAAVILAASAKYNLLATYVFFYYITYAIVKTLKPTLREPRPHEYQELPTGAPNFMKEDLSGPIEKYGMPSGHAAATIYTLAFAAATRAREFKEWFFWVGGFIAAAMYYQRFSYHRHTAAQLFAGTVIGASVAFLAVQAYKIVFQGSYNKRVFQ